MNTRLFDVRHSRPARFVGQWTLFLLLGQLTLSCIATEPHDNDDDDERKSSKKPSEKSKKESQDEDNDESESDNDAPEQESKNSKNKADKSNSAGCEEPKRVICDEDSEDPLHAFGINCPDDPNQIDATFSGVKAARGVLKKLGKTKAFDPREGKRYLVIGTGNVAELQQESPATDLPMMPSYCNDDLVASWDKKATLPTPINTRRVGKKDCMSEPSLIGTGDCSNTIQAQWEATAGRRFRANDLQELRIKAKVPEWAHSLSYDFAFLTTEYPIFYKNAFNDLFIAWMESKSWTGNISFDSNGNPISLNAGFLDYRDARQGALKDPECAQGCIAKELEGTCLKGHAGTRWLNTKVGVNPGEEIELVFTIVDLGDSMMDSYVLLDNFRWSCDSQKMPETDEPPV